MPTEPQQWQEEEQDLLESRRWKWGWITRLRYTSGRGSVIGRMTNRRAQIFNVQGTVADGLAKDTEENWLWCDIKNRLTGQTSKSRWININLFYWTETLTLFGVSFFEYCLHSEQRNPGENSESWRSNLILMVKN